MNPAPVYAPPKASAQRLESLRDLPLRDLEDVEASMMRVTAASLIEQALTWGRPCPVPWLSSGGAA